MTEQIVSIPGTRVGLVVPDGFELAKIFTGLQHRNTSSSVAVSEIPGPYEEIQVGFSWDSLAERGMHLVSSIELVTQGYPALLAHVTQEMLGEKLAKWVHLFGDSQETVLVTATFPRRHAEEMSELLKRCVLSARWDRHRKVDPFAELDFELRCPDCLKLAHRMQNTLLYTADGVMEVHSVDDPVVVMGQSVSEVDVLAKKDFARQRLMQTAYYRDIRIESEADVIVAGMRGTEICALAMDTESAENVFLYQVILFKSPTYYILQGIVAERCRERFYPVFKTMAESLRFKAGAAN